MMNFTEKDIKLIRGIASVAGIFTLVVALTMIFSLIQLKTIDPLDNPVVVTVKEQYDKDPDSSVKAEQVRAIDLMARKAYFASRRQVETGSYLLLAGAIVFIFCQRLLAGNMKDIPPVPGEKTNQSGYNAQYRKYLLYSASVLTVFAIIASFILRSDMPDLAAGGKSKSSKSRVTRQKDSFKPDKTNYPFFRGQDSRGIAGGSDYPVEWNGEEGKNIKWKIQPPKPGKSSPVIWENKLFITGAEGPLGEVYCINKNSGEIIWTANTSDIEGEPSDLPEMDQDAGLAVSTVATNGKAVGAVFANGNLICLDMDGKRLWATNLGSPKNTYGYASSLITFENTLIVQYDAEDKLSLMGFDIASGTLKWETLRSGRPVWSSPVIAWFGGEPQVVINGNPAVTGFDALTGKELWAVDCMSGDVAPSVAMNTTMVYAVTDYAKLAAIKPGPGASIIWEDNNYTPDVSSPVATDEFLFISTGNGDVACYDSQKGDTLWTRYYMDQFYSSPIIAGDLVYLLDRSGLMHIIKASGQYELISESPLGEQVDCTPAFSDKDIYIRGKNNLYCISEN